MELGQLLRAPVCLLAAATHRAGKLYTPAEHKCSSCAALSLQHISVQLLFDGHIRKETLVELS